MKALEGLTLRRQKKSPNMLAIVVVCVGVIIVASGISWLVNDRRSTGDEIERGINVAKSGDDDLAISIFSAVLKTDEKNTEALSQRALCYSAIVNFDEAIEDASEAIRIE